VIKTRNEILYKDMANKQRNTMLLLIVGIVLAGCIPVNAYPATETLTSTSSPVPSTSIPTPASTSTSSIIPTGTLTPLPTSTLQPTPISKLMDQPLPELLFGTIKQDRQTCLLKGNEKIGMAAYPYTAINLLLANDQADYELPT
jgi:hypothetical protein